MLSRLRRIWLADFQSGNEDFRRMLMSDAWDAIHESVNVLRQFITDAPNKSIEDAVAYTLEGCDAQYREQAIAGFVAMFETMTFGSSKPGIRTAITRAIERARNSVKS